ncbi:hypothetical protein HPB49_022905 [Dermacentor silvarum]|uniref:Uncharacterized protein n=1 Tax=Dermacentor silvarum TaxID=543639 RepID=A0ACB8DGG6_DERSI|nr:hypothetical protein HPB49_022905 [Dermacentor silvarum]
MQHALDTLTDYLKGTGMQLSPEKTKYILPGGTVQEKEKVELYLAGQKLERAPQQHVKILGIPIHEDGGAATWLKELEPTWKKLLHLVKRISQKRGGAGTDTARTLTSAVLTSRACYGAVCFDLTKAQYNKLERMHRECLRVITGIRRHTRVEDLHRELRNRAMQFGADELGLADVAKLAKQSKSVARRPFPGLDMMHGFMKKLQEMQMENRRQLALKNAAATPASAPSRKPALKDSTTSATSSLPQTTGSQRSTKPTLQIYRPPEMQCQQNEDIKASDTNDVQCQPSNTATDGNRVTYLKPRLNQSENRKTAINCGPMAYPKPRLDHSEVRRTVLNSGTCKTNPSR